MPAAVAVPIAVAAIGAGGAVANAKIQSNAAKRAAAAQQQASHEALDYQRGRDTMDDSRYDKKFALYNEAVQDWRKRNGGGGGGGVAIPNMVRGGASPVSIGDLVAGQGGQAATAEAPPGSIADGVSGWNDWRRYGA